MFFWNQYNETPLTEAVKIGDVNLVRHLVCNTSHRSAKNFMGFNALDLAFYVGNDEMLQAFGSHVKKTFKVLKKNSNCIVKMGIPEFEDFFQIKYIPSVRFSSYQEFYKVVSKCPGSLKKTQAGAAMRQLFEENRNKIRGGHVSNAVIKWIDEEMGYGLFTDEPIKKGEFVGEFAGFLIARNLLKEDTGDYCMKYPSLSFGLLHYAIDAEKMGNEMRFVNHQYTSNLRPVVALENGLSHSVLIAEQDIEPGEELTYDYGEDYWRWRDPPRDF